MKKVSKIKRFLSLALIFLFSINNFAAIVSDNDGSAFVTKAEFDALKNSFNEQIDDYNKSIDGKIDGAIAAYLSGITLSYKYEVEPAITNYNQIRWLAGPYWYLKCRDWKKIKDTTAAAYSDSEGWQIMTFKNYRNHNDGYWWFYNITRGSYAASEESGMIFVETRNSDFCNNYMLTGVHAPYYELKKYDDGYGWGTSSMVTVYQEQAIDERLNTNSGNGQWEYNRLNDAHWIWGKTYTDNFTLASETAVAGDILAYKIDGFHGPKSNSDHTEVTDNKIVHIKSKYVHFPYTKGRNTSTADWTGAFHAQMWNNSTAQGGVMPKDGVLPHEYKWKTEQQCKNDMQNTTYALFGTEIKDEINFAYDYQTDGWGSYYDLSGSNHTTADMKVKVSQIKEAKLNGYNGWNSTENVSGELTGISFSIPLWYRQEWKDVINGNYSYDEGKRYLKLGDGMPLVYNSQYRGELIVEFDFDEFSNAVDTTETPDQKIKMTIKNKNFNDSTGSYLKAFIGADTSKTELNDVVFVDDHGSRHVKLKFDDIKEGDSIWLKINPITTNGIYCSIKNLRMIISNEG